MSRRSYTYEDRLEKYRNRFFNIGIPGFPSKKESYGTDIYDRVDLYNLEKLGKTTKLTGLPRILFPSKQRAYVSDEPTSDYGCPFLNNHTIQKLHEKKLTEITLKDGSKISIFTSDNFGSCKNIVKTLWITENPGIFRVNKRIKQNI